MLPIALGAFLYVLCRPTTLLYERIIYLIVGVSWFPFKRYMNYSCRSIFADNFLYELVVYSLPNALWHFSLCYLLSFGLRSCWGEQSIVWKFRLVVFLLVAFVPDSLQIIGFMPGTFDVWDVLLASIVSVVVWVAT